MCILPCYLSSITYCGAIIPCRQRQSLYRIPIVVFAHGAFPAEMPHAQTLQKIFSVAEGDHAQGDTNPCNTSRLPAIMMVR